MPSIPEYAGSRAEPPELVRQLKVMRALYDISMDISSRLEIQQVFMTVVNRAAWLLNAKSSMLSICEPGTQLARVVALHNLPFEYEELVTNPGASAAGHVVATGEPIILNGLGEEAGHYPYNSLLSVPLTWEGKVVGALTVIDHREQKPFTEHDAQILGLLANLAATALNNAHLYSQVVQLNNSLEQKVKERTEELAAARKKLAQKAKQLELLLSATVYLQEEERAQIARDLHDGSSQLLTGALYEIQAAQQGIEKGCGAEALARLERAKELLRQISAEHRRITTGLRPPVLDIDGLPGAVEKLAIMCRQYAGAQCFVQITGEPFRLPSHTETILYRIAQEALNNAAAHAGARRIQVRMHFQPDCFSLEVEDDGVGFEEKKTADQDRMGLIGMRERAKSIGGRLSIYSRPGQGTKVSLTLPLPPLPPPHVGLHSIFCQGEALLAPEAGNGKKEEPEARWMAPTKIRRRPRKTRRKEGILDGIARAVKDIEQEKALALVQEALRQGLPALDILQRGVLEGLKAIGTLFESQYYFLGELLMGAKLVEACMETLKPHLPHGRETEGSRGVVVLGAVQGDLHSIGYGLVAHQLELAGYKVYNLGINVPSMNFINKALEVRADIIGLSAFLTSTIPYLKEVVDYLRDMGLRERFKVIIGGSETSLELAQKIGADGWAPNAVEAVALCHRLMEGKAR